MSIDKSAGKVEDSTEKELETKAEEHKAQAVNDANTVAHDPSKAEDLAKQRKLFLIEPRILRLFCN